MSTGHSVLLMAGDGVRVERRGSLLHVVLDAPERRNAMTPATWRRLALVPSVLEPSDRAVILSSRGASFSAGLDTRMFAPAGIPGETSLPALAAQDDAAIDRFIAEAQQAFTWWRTTPLITVACVQGHAIGAGFQLALACDLRLAAPDALFAMRETSWGLVPDLAGTGPLVEAVGYARALEICGSGRFLDARESLRIGLVLDVVETGDLIGAAELLIEPMLSASPGALGELKALLQGAGSAEDQCARERAAQLRRLRELALSIDPADGG